LMEKRKTVLTELITAAKTGYLLYDDVSDTSDNAGLSFTDFDWLMDQLSMRKVKIYDNADDVPTNDTEDENETQTDDYDLAHIDYEPIFNRIVEIEPSLAEFIDSVRNIQSARFGEYVYILDQLKKEDLPTDKRKELISRIIETHVRMAVAQALSFYDKHPYTSLAEEISIAYLGLVEAANKFDPNKNFTTISGSMSFSIFRALQRYSQTKTIVYYPVHIIEKLDAILYELYDFIKNDDFEGMVEMVASELHVNRKKAIDYANMYAGYINYEYGDDDPLYDSEDYSDSEGEQPNTYHNAHMINIAESRNVDPYLETEKSCMESDVQRALWDLTPREREVLDARYGLSDGISRTLDDVGSRYNLTRERIRQIEGKAIRKFKQKHRLLREYFSD